MASLSGVSKSDGGNGDKKDQAAAIEPAGHFTPTQWQSERTVYLTLSREIYSLKAVLATAYKFSADYVAWVDVDSEQRWSVALVAAESVDAARVLSQFARELNDQQLRVALAHEFGDLRTLIVAQAFSEGNLLDPQE